MGILGIIGMIIVGFIVGVLARFLYPGTVPLGFWLTAFLGIAGSLVGGVLSSLLWRSPDGKFRPAGWIMSIIGAMILIWAYLHHFCAGLRHLWMDVSHAAVTKEFGKTSAIATLAISLVLTVVLGLKLFGVY